MKIQYMSDLHMELVDNCRFIKQVEIPVTGEILVLAGDTFYLNAQALPLKGFWQWASENYQHVILVPGNHEYYAYCDIMERGLQWRQMIHANVGIYQNQVLTIGNTDFIISTLWSHIEARDEFFVQRGLADFHRTKYNGEILTVAQYNQLHEYCLDFIRKSVAASTAEHKIVVTHHLPTTLVVAPWHQGSVLNSAFATELGNFIAESDIDVWIYGHSHTNFDATIGKTRIVCNQLGYNFEYKSKNHGFSFGKCFTI